MIGTEVSERSGVKQCLAYFSHINQHCGKNFIKMNIYLCKPITVRETSEFFARYNLHCFRLYCCCFDGAHTSEIHSINLKCGYLPNIPTANDKDV